MSGRLVTRQIEVGVEKSAQVPKGRLVTRQIEVAVKRPPTPQPSEQGIVVGYLALG